MSSALLEVSILLWGKSIASRAKPGRIWAVYAERRFEFCKELLLIGFSVTLEGGRIYKEELLMSGFTFSEKQEEEIVGILAKYPFKKSAMLPLLTLVQRAERVISPEAMVAIGQKLDCSPAYVQSVLSFYTMYHTEKVGEYMVLFCINISCQLNGCDKLLQYTADKLDIKVGETTPDEKFTLHREECLADCTNAPMMRINDTFYGNLTEQRIDQILDSLG